MSLFARLVLSIVVAVIATLGCLLVGAILITLKVDIAVTVGHFFVKWGSVLGVLAGFWYFFSGATWAPWRRT